MAMADTLTKIKEFWGKLSATVKKLIIIGAAALVVLAVVIAIILNTSNRFIVLFPDMTQAESTEVYAILQERGVETKINSDGEIEVREEEWDALVFELASLGYPQSTPGYSTFFDNLSMTMTEFERKETLRFELQDRIQTTLLRVKNIKGAIVTLDIPDDDGYVWKENDDRATASVTLTLKNPSQFTSENVDAVKNLVAYATQKMDPDDVIVIDATTGVELFGVDENSHEYEVDSRENYERIVCNKYEANVMQLLEGVYGKGNVIVAAAVTINYDQVQQEVKEYLSNEEGYGVPNHMDTTLQGVDKPSDPNGIVGEEDNADIPGYVNGAEDYVDTDNTDFYNREVEYSVGYIFTQTEKAKGLLEDASISVVIKSKNAISDTEKQNVVSLVRNATNIQNLEKISVMSWLEVDESIPTPSENKFELTPALKWTIIILAGLVVFIILLMIIIISVQRKKHKKAEEAKQAAIIELEEKLDETQRKTLIEQAADANKAQKMAAQEVKKFAKENPELTASIIRSMLKEDSEGGE